MKYQIVKESGREYTVETKYPRVYIKHGLDLIYENAMFIRDDEILEKKIEHIVSYLDKTLWRTNEKESS